LLQYPPGAPEVSQFNRCFSRKIGWREATVFTAFFVNDARVPVIDGITVGKGFAFFPGQTDIRPPEAARLIMHLQPLSGFPLSQLGCGADDQQAFAVHRPEGQDKCDLQYINL
jgi:hypothetical protein